MTVFLYTLKRLIKNKVQLFLLLALPVIVILLVLCMSANSAWITIGVVDNDGTQYTKALKNSLGKNFIVANLKNGEIDGSIFSSKVTEVVEIPKGFTDDLIAGKSPKIDSYTLKEKDCSKAVGAAVDGFVYPSKLIAAKAGHNPDAFYAALGSLPGPSLYEHKKDSKSVLGLILMFMYLSSIFASSVIISDKEAGTFYRTFNSPIRARSYMIQSVLCFLLLSLFQLLVMLLISVLGFNTYTGKNPADMIMLLAISALSSVALGIAISSLCRTTVQAISIGLGVTVIMGMFGGAWGISPTTPLMIGISKITPYYWSMDAIAKLLGGKTFISIGGDLLILLAFSAVFFLAGSWRKEDTFPA